MKTIRSFFSSFSGYLRKWLRRINLFFLSLIWPVVALLLVFSFVFAHYLVFDLYFNPEKAPDIKPFIEYSPPTTGVIEDANGRVIIELAKDSQFRKIVSYDQIPPILVDAIISAEDERFFDHRNIWGIEGVDLKSIARAILYNSSQSIMATIDKRRRVIKRSQGASTITQQISRLWFLPELTRNERTNKLLVENWLTRMLANHVDIPTINSFSRKLEEMRIAIWLEREMYKIYDDQSWISYMFSSEPSESKKQMFVRFASYTYLGSGRYGVEAACEYYFGISCSQLSRNDADKAALLAGAIKSPATYAPRPGQSEEVRASQIERRNLILELMKNNGFITESEMAELSAKPINPVFQYHSTEAPSVVGDVIKEAHRYGFSKDDVYGGFVHVQSTVNLDVQKIANEALEKGLAEYSKRHPAHAEMIQGSVVVLRNSDGAILAEVGGRKTYLGREYKYSDLNRVNRRRPVGSVFKAFDYFTAFNEGKTPEDIIVDAPFSISRGYGRGVHWIHNYDGKYIGAGSLKNMLKGSRNIPAVKLVLSLGDGTESGMEKVERTIQLLGIKSPLHSDTDHRGKRMVYITSALGASEMTVLEVANGYRALATGTSVEPYMISKITGRDGSVLYEKNVKPEPLPFRPEAFKMIQYCLRRVVTQPGGTAYSLTAQKFPVPIAGKTGTTDDFRNAWFAGFTYGNEGITILARVDFDDNRNLAPKETGAVAALPIVREIFLKVYEQNLVGPAPAFPAELEDNGLPYSVIQ